MIKQFFRGYSNHSLDVCAHEWLLDSALLVQCVVELYFALHPRIKVSFFLSPRMRSSVRSCVLPCVRSCVHMYSH